MQLTGNVASGNCKLHQALIDRLYVRPILIMYVSEFLIRVSSTFYVIALCLIVCVIK